MLAYHDNNIVKALCYLFTELTPFESQLSSLGINIIINTFK